MYKLYSMSVIIILFLVVVLGFLVSSISGAPWVPARRYDIDELLEDAKLVKNNTYIELGCGDGRIVRAAAQKGAKAIGIELNPVLWLIAKVRTMNCPNAQIKFGNFWAVDLSQADVVMAFLVPRTMPRLGVKAAAEMKSGSRLVSYIFPVPDKKHTVKNKSWYVYIY
jgi:SAM-dependent methyltransferase